MSKRTKPEAAAPEAAAWLIYAGLVRQFRWQRHAVAAATQSQGGAAARFATARVGRVSTPGR